MKKAILALLSALIVLAIPMGGCGSSPKLNPNKPVTLTLWHNYGGQMQTTMDELVDEFNSTVGREKGVILSVTSISSSADLQEKLFMIANGDPGAPEMPNITTCYPQTALMLAQKGLVVDLDAQFTENELADYLPRFIEEGRLEGGKLYVFPIAKSTEVLFVNRTLFDRFSAATGVPIENMSTFEGIADAAVRYYEWTDAQTPDIPNDGKRFYTADSWFNIAQVGMRQLGGSLVHGEALDCSSPEYSRIWGTLYSPAVSGGFALFDGYSSDLSKTGDIICSTGSTAGILFYGDQITYADNTTEAVEYTILPYPTFEGGEKIAIQRGSGMCVASSSPEKEYASALFLKWFTAAKQNMKFVSSTGYLPVTNEAFASSMEQEIQNISNENIKKLLHTAITMQQNYDFYIPPIFDRFDALSKDYEGEFKRSASAARDRYAALTETADRTAALEAEVKQGLTAFAAR